MSLELLRYRYERNGNHFKVKLVLQYESCHTVPTETLGFWFPLLFLASNFFELIECSSQTVLQVRYSTVQYILYSYCIIHVLVLYVLSPTVQYSSIRKMYQHD